MPPTATTLVRHTARLAVLGDSLADSLGAGLAPQALMAGIRVTNGGIVGCGITTTPRYRLAGVSHDLAASCAAWQRTWTATLGASQPDEVAIMIGRHEVLDWLLNGAWTHIDTPEFDQYLSTQLDTAINLAGSTGAHVDVMTSPYFQRPEARAGVAWPENAASRVDRFNELVREAAARHPNTGVVDLGAYLSPGGRYAGTIDGVQVRSDGVHFTTAGVRWMAPWLLPRLGA